MFLCKDAYVSFFPQLWKTFTTTVENLFHNCGKKETKGSLQKNNADFVKKDTVLSVNKRHNGRHLVFDANYITFVIFK
jgi:hypothetical protein